ncbi:MAG: serine hydrolase domain-containing protein [Pirellulaceae bacterium]|nr:serine hydrolase domain-containing protein [Pirellulaceae bacterium]
MRTRNIHLLKRAFLHGMCIGLLICCCGVQLRAETHVAIEGTRWLINGHLVNAGTACEGLLMNVRMVNATFEDRGKADFDAERNTERFMAKIGDYVAHGVNAFTLCLQGGMPGYERADNSAFLPDGSLRPDYLARVDRVIRACDQHGLVVILGLYYQRQSKVLRDETAVRAGIVNAMHWIAKQGYRNVVVEVANEYPHKGFVHEIIRQPAGQASLLKLAKQTLPTVLLTASGYGDGNVDAEVAAACDFLTPHWNSTSVSEIPQRTELLKKFGKPIVCNEDDKTGEKAIAAMQATIKSGAGYGLMLKEHNQFFPFHFDGAADAPEYYQALRTATLKKFADYFPPAESNGGWRQVKSDEEIWSSVGMDPHKLAELREWLLQSDQRDFAAVVIRHGAIALQVERGNSASTDTRRVASVSKAVCATVLAIASERSHAGLTPRKMTFDDRAFDFIPWAEPLSDPRKMDITIRQLLNHTSGITPEALGARNDGSWEYVLGHSGDPQTEKLAFAPGTACGYSTHAMVHVSLVCEHVTGEPYDQFTINHLFQPLGIEKWWFQYYEGQAVERKASHGIGLPARELARIGYCMLRNGRWEERQVIPAWFVEQTGQPSSDVTTPEMRWKLNPQVFSLGWELPARHYPDSDKHITGIPMDARYKPGSGGQLLAFVPSLDLVIARQTGGSGPWDYEEFLRRACAAVQQ